MTDSASTETEEPIVVPIRSKVGLWLGPIVFLLMLLFVDLDPNNPVPSQLHHVKELCACMKNLKEGTIVAVDDHLNTPEFDQYRSTLVQGGKARFVEDFMKNIDAELLHDGYQIVWRL